MMFLINEDTEEREKVGLTPILEPIFQFQLTNQREHLCTSCSASNMNESYEMHSSMDIHLGSLPESAKTSVGMCITSYLATSEVVYHPIEEESRYCRKCKDAVDPNQSRDGFCEHTHNPCTGCGIQLSSSCSRRLFNTAPKVLWITFDRSKYDSMTGKLTRFQHRVRVDSYITLTILENVTNYRPG